MLPDHVETKGSPVALTTCTTCGTKAHVGSTCRCGASVPSYQSGACTSGSANGSQATPPPASPTRSGRWGWRRIDGTVATVPQEHNSVSIEVWLILLSVIVVLVTLGQRAWRHLEETSGIGMDLSAVVATVVGFLATLALLLLAMGMVFSIPVGRMVGSGLVGLWRLVTGAGAVVLGIVRTLFGVSRRAFAGVGRGVTSGAGHAPTALATFLVEDSVGAWHVRLRADPAGLAQGSPVSVHGVMTAGRMHALFIRDHATSAGFRRRPWLGVAAVVAVLAAITVLAWL